jgi:hypothetical protein
MQKVKANSKGKKRIQHVMTDDLYSKAVVASGVLTARTEKRVSVTETINLLFEKGFESLNIETKSVA